MSDPKKIPPTLEEVREYLADLGADVSPDQFYDYYEAKGWLVGRTPMKNWQAAVRLWNGNHKRWAVQRAGVLAEEGQLSEWEIKQKRERLADLRDRKRSITHPGGSAYSVDLTPEKLTIVAALEDKIYSIRRELGDV